MIRHISSHLKKLCVLSVTFALCLLILHNNAHIGAIPVSDLRSIYTDTVMYETGNSRSACNVQSTLPGLSSGNSVYMLGDSITNGASQKYRDAFSAKGVTPFINAVGGRAWIYSGSGSSGAYTPEAGGAQKGVEAIEADAQTITDSEAIIIALGSNGGLAANPIPEMYAAIRAKNATAPIWWVNVVASDTNTVPSVAVYGAFNEALEAQATTLGYSIINWHGTVIPGGNPTDEPTSATQDPNNYLSSDGLHPTSAGQDALVAQVVTTLTSGPINNTLAGNCSCSLTGGGIGTKEENYQNTWNYLVGVKGLSPEAAAGLMGNLEAESGINPQNTQDDAVDSSGNPVPDGPEIPIDLIRGKYGYGIAQWTSAGRQQGLVDFAAGPPQRSTGDLGLQLDYLWKELSESYTGVLAKLQEPEVTLNQASDEVLLRFEIPASVLPGAGEGARQSEINRRRGLGATIFNTYSGQPPGSFNGSACSGLTPNVNLTDEDTSDITCATGTEDLGIVTAYNDGKAFKIRICKAKGITVNSQIAGSVLALLTEAESANIALSGGGFRSLDGQIDIYKTHCQDGGITPTPPPYPKATLSAYTKCPGAAPPGYSNHEMGFAIDFSCNGALIPQSYTSAQDNPCFIWLSAHAGTYGLYEWGRGQPVSRTKSGYEGWHWSVDGS
jgi:lysophospholipase L1-like esterase